MGYGRRRFTLQSESFFLEIGVCLVNNNRTCGCQPMVGVPMSRAWTRGCCGLTMHAQYTLYLFYYIRLKDTCVQGEQANMVNKCCLGCLLPCRLVCACNEGNDHAALPHTVERRRAPRPGLVILRLAPLCLPPVDSLHVKNCCCRGCLAPFWAFVLA